MQRADSGVRLACRREERVLARISDDPARSAEQAADAAADAAGVQLSNEFCIVEMWCPEAKGLEPAQASGVKLLDDFHR